MSTCDCLSTFEPPFDVIVAIPLALTGPQAISLYKTGGCLTEQPPLAGPPWPQWLLALEQERTLDPVLRLPHNQRRHNFQLTLKLNCQDALFQALPTGQTNASAPESISNTFLIDIIRSEPPPAPRKRLIHPMAGASQIGLSSKVRSSSGSSTWLIPVRSESFTSTQHNSKLSPTVEDLLIPSNTSGSLPSRCTPSVSTSHFELAKRQPLKPVPSIPACPCDTHSESPRAAPIVKAHRVLAQLNLPPIPHPAPTTLLATRSSTPCPSSRPSRKSPPLPPRSSTPPPGLLLLSLISHQSLHPQSWFRNHSCLAHTAVCKVGLQEQRATHSLGDVPDQKPVKYACSRVRRSRFLQNQLQCPARIADQFKQTINQLGLQLAELKHKSPSKAQLDAFACAHINTTLAALSDRLAKCQSYDKLVQLKASASLSGLKETQAQIVAQLSSTRPSSPSATSSNKTNCNAPHPSIPSEQSSANCSSNPPQNQPTLTSILLGPQATSSPPPSRRRQRMSWHPPLSPQPIGPISTTTQQPGRRPLAQEKRAGLAANVAA
ncbi:hypothetical protein PCANC_13816 [Puccinia coronata f. sp. avenae]|uniref:Uncharacterized protein n=1 Tax=Puccinia coronata f. sp. avenae TaxID=200324 RepID=A0A2N5UD62_9BASI|nr:hypothetical protein PCANC_13816 [Puccinia coronata f. sp. avenae]